MSFTDRNKQISYSGYNTGGEFKVEYAYNCPILLENGSFIYNQNTLSSKTRFITLGNDATEIRRRFQEINATIPDNDVAKEPIKRNITVEYGQQWQVEEVRFEGQFRDDAGNIRTLSMYLGPDLKVQTSPFSPDLMVFVDGNIPDERMKDVSKKTLKRVRTEIYEFCRTSLNDVAKLQDNKGRSVMETQLAQIKDYEEAIEIVRRKIERKHALEEENVQRKNIPDTKQIN